jgi:acetyl esterase
MAALIADMDSSVAVDLADPDTFRAFRAAFDASVRAMRGELDTSAYEVAVQDELIDADVPVPVRIYEPHVKSAGAVVFFHGGGWVVGTLDTLDPELRWFAHRLGARVISVDYRLAPENRYPAPLDDCMAVLRDVARGSAHGPIAVAGDSAGGNLAAAAALLARDEGLPLSAQLLIYPALDATLRQASYTDFAEGFLLTRAGMEFNWSSYLGPHGDEIHPLASPLAHRDLSGVAPAVIVTAGYDPLRDEGVEYGRRLRAAGVPCVHLHHPGLAHGFLAMAGRVPAAGDAIEQFLYHLADLITETGEAD